MRCNFNHWSDDDISNALPQLLCTLSAIVAASFSLIAETVLLRDVKIRIVTLIDPAVQFSGTIRLLFRWKKLLRQIDHDHSHHSHKILEERHGKEVNTLTVCRRATGKDDGIDIVFHL